MRESDQETVASYTKIPDFPDAIKISSCSPAHKNDLRLQGRGTRASEVPVTLLLAKVSKD